MIFAPGVSFNEESHEYWYNGRKLSGITGLITKKLGLKMPQEFVEEHQMEGIHIHKSIQNWISTGKPDSVHPGVKWITETFHVQMPNAVRDEAGNMMGLSGSEKPKAVIPYLNSEVLVSDFKQYASAVDIVAEVNGSYQIFDIKKGVFKRDYVTWQLSIYKYFIEEYAKKTVTNCVCICVRDKEYYDIFPKPKEQIEKLLYSAK